MRPRRLTVSSWLTSERSGIERQRKYHDAGGWPAHGFSQSSGIHDVWNFWIIYPLIAWGLYITAQAWAVYRHKPISERVIQTRGGASVG